MDYFKIDPSGSAPKDKDETHALMIQMGLLSTPLFTIGEIGITHRWITHWDKLGLIDSDREDTSWRRFTFVEYVWLRVIVELRKFHMSLTAIKAFKGLVFQPSNFTPEEMSLMRRNVEGSGIPLPDWIPKQLVSENLEFLLSHINVFQRSVQAAVFTRESISFLISADGDWEVIDGRDTASTVEGVQTILSLIEKKNFICINLQHIIREFYKNKKVKADVARSMSFLSEQEVKILDVIRQGDFKEIVIKENKKEKEYKISVTKEFPVSEVSSRILGLITSNDLEEIKILGAKGQAVLFERTTRHKF